MIYAVIMAGGKGERFWPLSRGDRPKQLLTITSDKTMIEETIERTAGFIPLEQTRIVTSESMRDNICRILPQLRREQIYTEPFGRNTCLAIALSALQLQAEDPEAVMVVLASDHLITPKEKLLNILKIATELCSHGNYLITLGITPTRAETGYGYIEEGELIDTIDGISIYRVSEFKEKPTRVLAQQYYYDRKHLWNSGMFVWSVRSILEAIRKHQPEQWSALQAYSDALRTADEPQAKRELYVCSESISVDVAVLEKADNVLTIKADLVWDDVGSWLALDRIRERDGNNNVRVGKVALEGSFETIVYNDSDGLIAALGVSDLVVVRTGDIVMVAHKTRVGEIKDFLSKFNGEQDLERYL